MELWLLALCCCLLIMTYGLTNVLTGVQQVGQTAQDVAGQAQDVAGRARKLTGQTDVVEVNEDAPRGVSETEAQQVGGEYPF